MTEVEPNSALDFFIGSGFAQFFWKWWWFNLNCTWFLSPWRTAGDVGHILTPLSVLSADLLSLPEEPTTALISALNKTASSPFHRYSPILPFIIFLLTQDPPTTRTDGLLLLLLLRGTVSGGDPSTRSRAGTGTTQPSRSGLGRTGEVVDILILLLLLLLFFLILLTSLVTRPTGPTSPTATVDARRSGTVLRWDISTDTHRDREWTRMTNISRNWSCRCRFYEFNLLLHYFSYSDMSFKGPGQQKLRKNFPL